MWRIKRHGHTKLSATESEWMAQSELLKMALVAYTEATFLGLKLTLPLLFFCDNEGTGTWHSLLVLFVSRGIYST